MASVLGLGLAALGRPGYLNVGHGRDIGASHSIEALERRCHDVGDAAWDCGIRWFDAARSYGLAEQFLAGWLHERGIGPADVTVSSKWGYTYTTNWQVDADPPEVKDHSLVALQRQWPETQAFLGPWLRLYQVHSATLDSGILEHADVHRTLTGLGCPVGLSLSGPRQAETLRQALRLTVDDRGVFSSVQATWNLLEPSVGLALAEAKAAGWTVIVKEALANGRLAASGRVPRSLGGRPDVIGLAAALAQPWVDVVLGAATVDQVRSNADAVAVAVDDLDLDRLGGLAVDPQSYWDERAALPWT